jgi:hypothetical protein
MSDLRVRPPAVAGRFYPAEPEKLKGTVDRFIEEGKRRPSGKAEAGGTVKAIIAPHAGYVYSGSIAGTVYARVASLRGKVNRVILIGPAHYVGFRGIAVCGADFFRTPLGDVPVDRESVAALQALPEVVALDRAHVPDHALEVQLPFLQRCLGDFKVVPLLAGNVTGERVAAALKLLWGDERTLIVVSSDLSHFLDYEEASAKDHSTAEAIEQLNAAAIESDQACGGRAIQGILQCAIDEGLQCRLLDLRNSGDTAGTRDRVVGYGAFIFLSGNIAK